MNRQAVSPLGTRSTDLVLQAYMLGPIEFEAALALQRRLAFQVAGESDHGALVLCEHSPLVTIGRHGSRAHIRCEYEELRLRGWPVRWVNRGGGCILHVPGQLAIYPIVALDRLRLGLEEYQQRLRAVAMSVLGDFAIAGETRPGSSCIWVGRRPIAAVGVAVRSWVTYYGMVLNIHPDLELFRRITCADPEAAAMTSIERERRAPLRPALVRELILERFADQFGFRSTSLFFDHPSLSRKAPSDAVPAAR